MPRILSPEDADRLVGTLRTHRDRAMVLGMLLAGPRRCEVLGLRFEHVQVADRRLMVTEGKGGHHRVVPAANRFFDELGAYLHDERPGRRGHGQGVRGAEGAAARAEGCRLRSD